MGQSYWVLVVGAVLGACSPAADSGPDGGATPVAGDAGVPPGRDAGIPDVGAPDPNGGILLVGTVLAPEGPIQDGQVLVLGDTIACVGTDCATDPSAQGARVIATAGVIAPGLIDAHNHLAYDFFTEWEAGRAFQDRYQWSDDPGYEDHIRPYAERRSAGTHFCPAAKWGELRALVHGTTTVQGQSFNQGCINRLVRNADHMHGLGHDHMRTSIASPRDITDAQAESLIADFTSPTRPVTRFAVHMAEGLPSDRMRSEHDSFAGRDTRNNRHAGRSLLADEQLGYRGTAVLIHALGLADEQLVEAREADAKIVWSPSSNMVLYGMTANIGRMLELGLTVGLGPDWTVSGEADLLAEMRFALRHAEQQGIDALSAERVVRMVTADGAVVVGLEQHIGALRPGMRADIAVFEGQASDPYRAVIESRAQDVALVLIDGQGYFGDARHQASVAVNSDCEPIVACGAAKFLCVKNTPGAASRADESLDDIRNQLLALLEGAPPSLPETSRELLPLFLCDR